MEQFAEELFKNCKRYEDMSDEIIKKYQNRVSEEIITF